MRQARGSAIVVRLLLVITMLALGIAPAAIAAEPKAAASPDGGYSAEELQQRVETMKRSYVSQEQREAAALRMKLLEKVGALGIAGETNITAFTPPAMVPGGVPHYFGPTPNWAYSPLIRKFVDSLPGVGFANRN